MNEGDGYQPTNEQSNQLLLTGVQTLQDPNRQIAAPAAELSVTDLPELDPDLAQNVLRTPQSDIAPFPEAIDQPQPLSGRRRLLNVVKDAAAGGFNLLKKVHEKRMAKNEAKKEQKRGEVTPVVDAETPEPKQSRLSRAHEYLKNVVANRQKKGERDGRPASSAEPQNEPKVPTSEEQAQLADLQAQLDALRVKLEAMEEDADGRSDLEAEMAELEAQIQVLETGADSAESEDDAEDDSEAEVRETDPKVARIKKRASWTTISLFGAQALAQMGIRMGLRAGMVAAGAGASVATLAAGFSLSIARLGLKLRKREKQLIAKGIKHGVRRRSLYELTTRDKKDGEDLKGWRKSLDTLGWVLDLPTDKLMRLAANISKDKKNVATYQAQIEEEGGIERWVGTASAKDIKRLAQNLTRLKNMGYGIIDVKNREKNEQQADELEKLHQELDDKIVKYLEPSQSNNVINQGKLEAWQRNGSLNDQLLKYAANEQYMKMIVAVAAGKLATLGTAAAVGIFVGDAVNPDTFRNLSVGEGLSDITGGIKEVGADVSDFGKGVVTSAGDKLAGIGGDLGEKYSALNDAVYETHSAVKTGIGTAITTGRSVASQAFETVQEEVVKAGTEIRGVAGTAIDSAQERIADIDTQPVKDLIDAAPVKVNETLDELQEKVGLTLPTDPSTTPQFPPFDQARFTAMENATDIDAVNEITQTSLLDRFRGGIESVRQGARSIFDRFIPNEVDSSVADVAQADATDLSVTAEPAELVTPKPPVSELTATESVDLSDTVETLKESLAKFLGYTDGIADTLIVSGGESPEEIANFFNGTLGTTQSGIFEGGLEYSSNAANAIDIALASGRSAFTDPEAYDLFVKELAKEFPVKPGEYMIGYQDIITKPRLKELFDQLVFAQGKEAVVPKIVNRLAAEKTFAAVNNLKPR